MYSANILHNIHVLTTELCSKSLDQGQQTMASEPNLATMGFVNKIALAHSHAYSLMCCLWLLHALTVQLSSCNREHNGPQTPKSFLSVLYQKWF